MIVKSSHITTRSSAALRLAQSDQTKLKLKRCKGKNNLKRILDSKVGWNDLVRPVRPKPAQAGGRVAKVASDSL
jgi:hypothetical protein